MQKPSIIYYISFILLQRVLSQYLFMLNEQYQYYTYQFKSGRENFNEDDCFSYGVWSQYLPLSAISQVGLVGMFESHCFHQHSIVENSNQDINLVYYDCVDQISNTVVKKISFISSDQQQQNFEYSIDVMKYENHWYFFGIALIPAKESLRFSIYQGKNIVISELFFIQNPFKDQELKIVVGGGLIVDQSQSLKIEGIQKLSYFPGRLGVVSPIIDGIFDDNFGLSILEYYARLSKFQCQYEINQVESLPDFYFTKLSQDIFASENKNCDEFSLETWIKISDYHQVDSQFIYKLMKISANFENNYANNDKLSAFQLFYEFSNSQIKIMVTTYSILFPLVEYQKEQQLLKKEWVIINNIKLWHFLSVILSQNVLSIQITFYEGSDQSLYEAQFSVNQYHQVQFKLSYGNLLQTFSNYLTGILKTLNLQIMLLILLHCEECDGPTKTDCLSCPQQSKRIYFEKYKVCLCPINYIDDINCKGLEDYQFLDQNFDQGMKQNCPQGYFILDELCFQCPTFIKDNYITCLECIQNPINWRNDPHCKNNLYIEENEKPANYIVDKTNTYFIFDGDQVKPCQSRLNQDLNDIEEIYNDFEETNVIFNRLCQQSYLGCYTCFDFCSVCFMEITQQTLIISMPNLIQELKLLPNKSELITIYIYKIISTEIAIECIDRYAVNKNYCGLYCDQSCILCKKDEVPQNGFTCNKCSQDYYMEPLKSVVQEKCLPCPLLCQVCQQRTYQEIQQINPEFLINDSNIIYTHKCIQKRPNSKVMVDPLYQIAKFCFNDKCDSLISKTIQNCYRYIFDEFRDYDEFDEINFQYLNHIGAQKFQLIIPIQDQCYLPEMYFKWHSLSNDLRIKTFSLNWVELKFEGNYSPANYVSQININNFDSIIIEKILYEVLDPYELVIAKYTSNLIIADSIFFATSYDSKKIQIQIEQCRNFQFSNITLSNLNLLNSVIFLIQFQSQDSHISLSNFKIQNCNLTNTIIFQLSYFPKISFVSNLTIENCQFNNSTILNFIQDINTFPNLNLNTLQIIESKFVNSILINGTDKYLLNFSQISLKQSYFDQSKFLKFQNSLVIENFKLLECSLFQSFLFFKVLQHSKSINFSLNQFDIQNNLLIDTSLVFMEQQSTIYKVYINLSNFYLNQNRIPKAVDFSTFLFNMNCYSLNIKQFKIINSQHLQYFYLLNISLIAVEDLQYINLVQNHKVPISIECLQYKYENSQLFQIQGFSNLLLAKIEIKNQYSIDTSFIQILSHPSAIISQHETITIKDLNCQGNIILTKGLGLMISELAIYSEQQQTIELENIYFYENSFNQLYDDSSLTASGLLFINSQSSQVFIKNLISQRNALTNSTNSFIYINVISLNIINLLVSNHNQLNQSHWTQYFNIDFDENFNQDQINQMINYFFTIQNKGGVLSVTTEYISIKNCDFKQILAQSSFMLEITTLGYGMVNIQNCSIKQSQTIYSQFGENYGAISIYSKNSLLQLDIQNIYLSEIHNRQTSSILSVIPSFKQNILKFKNIIIEDCFSLVNQFMKIQFQLLSLQSSVVIIENISIIATESKLIQYFQKVGVITTYEIQKITNDNAFINLQGCNLTIQNLTFQGILISPIVIILDSQRVLLRNFLVENVQSFYPLNMIHIGQISSIEYQVFLWNIQIINIQFFDYTELQTVLIESSILQKDNNFCQINFQSRNQGQNSPIKLSWIFEQIAFVSNQKGSIIYFQSMNNQNKIKIFKILIFNNDCQGCWNGIIFFDLDQYLSIQIQELQCIKNKIKNNGCIVAKSSYQQESKLKIIKSIFNLNKGTIGTAVCAENVTVYIENSKLLSNIASQLGGALYLSIINNQFKISQTIIYNNKASKAGGIYLEGNNNINEQNFIYSWMKLNSATLQPNNIQEMPTQLVLSINNIDQKAIQKLKNNILTNYLTLKPYKIIQQGKQYLANQLIIPSNQEIVDYKIYDQKHIKFQIYIEEFSVNYENSLKEILLNFSNSTCDIFRQSFTNNSLDLIDSKKVATVEYSFETKNFNLGFLSVSVDPYQNENQIQQIQIVCHINQVDNLYYDFEIKGFMCQLGEFYVQQGCQKCQPSQGYYSVTYNTTKCSIFDKNKFQSITSNQIELKVGYWRPDYQSDYTESCFKFLEYCQGGWFVSDEICKIGHIGALCEECDIYNIRGHGNFFKNQQNQTCQHCGDPIDNILPFTFISIWAIISIILTLRSIEKSNKLFSTLKIRQKFSKIIFKLNQDHESILLKLFLNYVWIFSVIFTFNINFSFSFTFVNQTSNTSYFMANHLDCYLSDTENIYLIYNRIIITILLMMGQLLLIYLGFQIYCNQHNINNIFTLIYFKLRFIDQTIFFFVSNKNYLQHRVCLRRCLVILQFQQSSLMDNWFCPSRYRFNWLSYPIFSLFPFIELNGKYFQYILGNINLQLFFNVILNFKRDKLDQIQFRKHICYLFNEYNVANYFWEWIKLWKKTVIIIIMTYFETDILLKTSLLGLCLFLYQVYAVKQKPYIIKNLNELDVSTVQICSVAIFLASINYVSEQQENQFTSIFTQLVLVLLFLSLSFPFIIALLRVYYKKYKISFLTNLYLVLKFIKIDSRQTIFANKLILKLRQREFRLKSNFIKLRAHLLQISKLQLEQQKTLLNFLNSEQVSRQGLFSFEYQGQKLLKIDKI